MHSRPSFARLCGPDLCGPLVCWPQWFRVGLVAARNKPDTAAAILAQKKLLVDTARATHKVLRPLATLALSYGTLEDVERAEAAGEPLRLGSFSCPNCGHFNVASAKACANCGSARDETFSPRGALSAVSRTRLGASSVRTTMETCGFLATSSPASS